MLTLLVYIPCKTPPHKKRPLLNACQYPLFLHCSINSRRLFVCLFVCLFDVRLLACLFVCLAGYDGYHKFVPRPCHCADGTGNSTHCNQFDIVSGVHMT